MSEYLAICSLSYYVYVGGVEGVYGVKDLTRQLIIDSVVFLLLGLRKTGCYTVVQYIYARMG